MAKLSNLQTFSLLIIFTFSLIYHVTSSFTPIDNYLINCGSPLLTIQDSYNREFTSDESPLPDSVKLSSTRTIPLTELTTPSGRLYNSARIFVEPSSYSFKINQKGTHLIRLHFHRLNFEKFDGKFAKFHVLADGYLLLHEFSLLNLKNDVEFEIHEFLLPIDCDILELSFIPVGKTSFGFISAIELVSTPKDLILDIAESVNSNGVSKINGMVKNGFETLFRVNVGGPKITPFNDTLWRTWVPDTQFLNSRVESKEVHFSGRIKYQVGGASREVAPDHVYGSARVMARSNASDESKDRLIWGFPVVGGYKYLVRVHFCDIVSRSLGSLYFNVYVNGILANENLDLSTVTNSLASPYYIDLVVDGGASGVITVGVGSSSSDSEVNAILNGVEVFKMSNSMKSFDGMVSAETVLRSCQGRNSGFPLVFAIAIGVLLAVSLLLRKILVKVQDNVAWSRLPVDISEVALKSSYQ